MYTINLQKLASKLEAYNNCVKSNNTEWKDKHEDSINEMLENLPHGSGIDAGIKFDWQESTKDKMIFTFGFHHMDENGYYDGWTEHKLIVTPTFGYFDMRITGKDRNMIKDYLYQLFHSVFCVSDLVNA